MKKSLKDLILPYSVGIAIPLLVGTLSAFITMGDMDIYSVINIPPLAPPALLFPIVWTVLYVLMGISSTTVFLKRKEFPETVRQGLSAYAASLALNFGWSIIFFKAGAFLFAFAWLILMLYFIVRTVIAYFKVSRLSAYLQIPYILWVCFAGYLNFAIYLLN